MTNITLGEEKFEYSKDQLKYRLMEIYELTLTFVKHKDLDPLKVCLTELVKDDFTRMFRIPYWKDVLPRGSRLHDLILLYYMLLQVKQFSALTADVPFTLGKALMQEIADHVMKLFIHDYAEEG